MAGDVKPFLDIKLENRVLRCLIFNPAIDNKEVSDEILNNIGYMINAGPKPDIFYSSYKQWLFQAIFDNYMEHSECISKDMLSEMTNERYDNQSDRDKRNTTLDKVSGSNFEKKFFKSLFDKLLNKYHYRLMFDMMGDAGTMLKEHYDNDEDDPSSVALKIEDTVNSVLFSTNKVRIKEEDVFTSLDQDIFTMKEMHDDPDKFKGITSGFEKIDLATGGWRAGELIFVLGRPGVGKSVLLLNFAYNAYKMRNNVIFITIEMPFEQQKMRLHSLMTGRDYRDIKMPEYMEETEITSFGEQLKDIKDQFDNYFWIIDAPERCNTSFIESRVTAFENITRQKADMVVIDPIYLMQPTNSKTEDPVGTISWELKILARKLGIPCMVASQFNRASVARQKHGSVDSSDAAFSDKIGQNADILMGLVGKKEDDRVELHFPKSRDSEISKVILRKRFNIMNYEYDQLANSEGDSEE